MYFSILYPHSINSVLSSQGLVFGASQMCRSTREHVTMKRLSANSRLLGNSMRFDPLTR